MISVVNGNAIIGVCHTCSCIMTVCAGEVGSATSMKLVVNMLFGTMLAGLAETLALGEKVGLQQEQILEILSLLPISSKLNVAKGDGLFTGFVCLSHSHSFVVACLFTIKYSNRKHPINRGFYYFIAGVCSSTIGKNASR